MKGYVKPTVVFQSLSLSTTIAAGCAIDSTHDAGVCPVEIPGHPGLTVFAEGTECLTYSPGIEDQICYHVPLADMNVFES